MHKYRSQCNPFLQSQRRQKYNFKITDSPHVQGHYLRNSLTWPWLVVMVGHWLTSGMERSLARWEESQGMRAELEESQRSNK